MYYTHSLKIYNSTHIQLKTAHPYKNIDRDLVPCAEAIQTFVLILIFDNDTDTHILNYFMLFIILTLMMYQMRI